MVVDSSALIAILENEKEALALARVLDGGWPLLVSAGSYFETSMVVLSRRGENGKQDLENLLLKIGAEIVPFTRDQVWIARRAFMQYGKGRHPAGLNFGDCMAYALAKETGEPLLFKGTDFSKTDIAVAAY